MKYARNGMLMLLIIVFGSSCAPRFVVSHDKAHNVNFDQYATYTVEPVAYEQQGDPVFGSPLVQEHINDAIAREMNNRGYAQTDQNPDLIIRHRKDVEQRRDEQTRFQPQPMGFWGPGMGWGPGWGWGMRGFWGPGMGWGWGANIPYTHVRMYEQGRLIVDVIDARTNRLIWQGFSEGEVNRRRAIRQRERSINDKVARIMRPFPERTAPAPQEGITQQPSE